MAAGTSRPLFYHSVWMRGEYFGAPFLNYLTQRLLLSSSTFLSSYCEVGLFAAEENLPPPPQPPSPFSPKFSRIFSPLGLWVQSPEDARETFLGGKISDRMAELRPQQPARPDLWFVTSSTLSSHPPSCFQSALPDPALRSPPSSAPTVRRCTSTTAQLKIIQPWCARSLRWRPTAELVSQPPGRPTGGLCVTWNASRSEKSPISFPLWKKVKSLNGQQKRRYFPRSLEGAAGSKSSCCTGKGASGQLTRDIF